MSRYFRSERVSNPSANPTLSDVLGLALSRRDVLAGGAAAVLAAALPGCTTGTTGRARRPDLTFTPISVSTDDAVRVPPEYEARVLYAWGDPVGARDGMPSFKMDASNSAAEQALQAGMHHDGMHFYPLPPGSTGSRRGVLAMNHEYADDGLLHTDGMRTWSAEKVAKSQHAVGVSVIEVELGDDGWRVVRPSPYARRVTARTPCRISGAAAGSPLMRTEADPAGREVLGTYNGCAHGWTPWGTYLTCEENWNFQFVNRGTIPADQRRYGITAKGRGYRWEEHDPRFDAGAHPNEPNRFGWVVEIDPYEPGAPPVKRTGLGRFKHEGATPSVGPSGRIAFYMGDDEGFEYLYKFVTRDAWNPRDRAANRDLLDHGTLYVARFSADGSGEWLPLVHGAPGLGPAEGFADQAAVVVRTRQAADAVRATSMDRGEWIAVHPTTREVYLALTNNTARGRDGREGANPANPRVNNVFGHIVRWREAGDDPAATRFTWDVFVLAGDPGHADAAKRGDIRGDIFGSPDGLHFDQRGVLWVQTDVSPTTLNKGDYAPMGNNQVLAVDPAEGVFRRFMTGPRGCEITGFTTTPDNRTAFVNIQHPGENPGERNDPDNPRAISNWPDFDPAGRPRSATVVIRRKDGGVIGT